MVSFGWLLVLLWLLSVFLFLACASSISLLMSILYFLVCWFRSRLRSHGGQVPALLFRARIFGVYEYGVALHFLSQPLSMAVYWRSWKPFNLNLVSHADHSLEEITVGQVNLRAHYMREW
jgi:hypothetical protein